MGQMTADQYLDQIQNQLMKTLTEKKDAMPPGFNQQRFALNCITVIRDMMKDYKKREQLQTVDINSIVLCMIKGAYLGLDFLNGECYAIPYKGEMTFQTDYKGEIKVCKRFSDDPIKDIYAKVVREGDTQNLSSRMVLCWTCGSWRIIPYRSLHQKRKRHPCWQMRSDRQRSRTWIM